MSRYYRLKTHKLYKNSRLLTAAKHIQLWNCSIREASGLYSIPYSTLRRCVQRSDKISLKNSIRKPVKAPTMTKEQEAEFLANMCFQNRTFKQFRQLAFQQSQVLRLKVPTNWKRNKAAGVDWANSFLKRYPAAGLFIRRRKNFYLNETKCPDCRVVVPKKMVSRICSQCNGGVCLNCFDEHSCGNVLDLTP